MKISWMHSIDYFPCCYFVTGEATIEKLQPVQTDYYQECISLLVSQWLHYNRSWNITQSWEEPSKLNKYVQCIVVSIKQIQMLLKSTLWYTYMYMRCGSRFFHGRCPLGRGRHNVKILYIYLRVCARHFY